MNKDTLSNIFSDDPLGLLEVAAPLEYIKPTQAQQKLIDSFIEINEFYEEYGKEPSLTGSVDELMLASRLQAMRNNPKSVSALMQVDFYNLLKCEHSKSLTVETILGDDPLSLLTLDEPDKSIFSLKYVKKSDRIRPDYISRRNICTDFEDYEVMFKAVHDELRSSTRKLIAFKEQDLSEGKFFVLRGVLLYLVSSDTQEQTIHYESGTRTRNDGRTRCVFDNGTESDMLFRSLYKALIQDGFSVGDRMEPSVNSMRIADTDTQNGYIYVLSSLSSNPQISNTNNLYKIGCCRGDVTERIRNASNEPTYLMSDVRVELAVRCFNLNIHALEGAVHHFFANVNIAFEVYDKDGNKHYPREWFIAPLDVIQSVIQIAVNGEIGKYRYNAELGMPILM